MVMCFIRVRNWSVASRVLRRIYGAKREKAK
jgi:hypothetical protein